MSDKLFKNDLTPSACQSDGNFGQVAAFLSLPPFSPCHALHNSLVPCAGENPPQRRHVLDEDVAH